MQAIGVIGLGLAEVDLFPQPPRRSAPRSSPRRRPRVMQRVRRFLATADALDGVTPPLRHYPY